MKKYLPILIFIGLAVSFSILARGIEFRNPLEYDTFGELVNAIISFIFVIASALTPLLVIIGAFFLLTAAGDPKRVTTGKTIIIYTLIGFVIILFAKGLIAIIEQVLGVR